MTCVRCSANYEPNGGDFYGLCKSCFMDWSKVATYGHLKHWSVGGTGYSKDPGSKDFDLWLERFPYKVEV